MYKTKTVSHFLFPMLNRKNPFSIDTKLYTYKNYMHPILIYACLSSKISNTNSSKIESVQSITLRKITNLHYYVFNYTIRKPYQILSIAKFLNSVNLKLIFPLQ